MPHFVIFENPQGGHPAGFLLRADTLLDAIRRFLQEENDDLAFHPDGTVGMVLDEEQIVYPHVLAYVEALYKTAGDWQIRRLSEDLKDRDCTELFVAEHPFDIQGYIRRCRPRLREDTGRSRLPAFIWYLDGGPLVTFYRKRQPFRIEVVRRYLLEDSTVSPWHGDYEVLTERLWLGPSARLA